jgi:UDP-N-acetylmuramoyl-L-alanyl-D-glutamate--2,6-diaminopimelate ligase
MIRLKKLLKGLVVSEIRGNGDVAITGLSSHSKLVAPGHLFITRSEWGERTEGYVREAVDAGAVAVVTDLVNPVLQGCTQVICEQPRHLEAILAARFYQYPASELVMVGITGTNGKTTSAYLVRQLLEMLEGPYGLLGTVEWQWADQKYPAQLTTPDSITLQRFLREMVTAKCRGAVMEVTSHGLTQGRVDQIDFDVGVFTNLTQDHLDYHQTMEAYGSAKAQLFARLGRGAKEATAIINWDDPWGVRMVADCRAPIIRIGLRDGADLQAQAIEMSATGTRFVAVYQGQRAMVHTCLVGEHNVYNILCAMGVALARRHSLDRIAALCANCQPVVGRLEPVTNSRGLTVYVDYAHTPDALRRACRAIRAAHRGRLLVVFGAGGDRDRTKRPQMAQACQEEGDYSVVTSDNPRTEDPSSIAHEIVAGFNRSDCYEVELDRRKAIEKAIQLARPGDVVLIAGKGHEAMQLIHGQAHPFRDQEVAAQILGSA